MGLPNPSREAKFSGGNEDREIIIFPFQLTTSRIGNLTRLIYTLLYVMTIDVKYRSNNVGHDIRDKCARNVCLRPSMKGATYLVYINSTI